MVYSMWLVGVVKYEVIWNHIGGASLAHKVCGTCVEIQVIKHTSCRDSKMAKSTKTR